jgi:hypothetical protein
MALIKENKDIVILGYQDFSNKFENLFEVTGNGSLRADKTKLNEIREWISRDDTKHIILSLTGLKLAGIITLFRSYFSLLLYFIH